MECNSDDVETFKTAYKKYGDSHYLGLTVGNEVNKFFVKFCMLYSVLVTSRQMTLPIISLQQSIKFVVRSGH